MTILRRDGYRPSAARGGSATRFRQNTARNRYRGTLALYGALLWIACPAAAVDRTEGTSAHYSGPISAAGNQSLFGTVGGKPVERLIITSSGGEVEAGIALGTWVHERGIDIEVSDYCLSSCANYVFPAGRRKIIRPGAVVAWHGNYTHLVRTGLWRDDIAARREKHGEDEATATIHARTEAERLSELEQDFFARIGVDGYLCWIGKMPPYHSPDYYFLSRDDMARFGVTDVSVPADYAGTDVSGFDFRIEYIELE